MLTFVDILNYWGLPESPGPARLRSPIFEPDLYHRSPWYFMVMDICVYGSLMSARDSYTIHEWSARLLFKLLESIPEFPKLVSERRTSHSTSACQLRLAPREPVTGILPLWSSRCPHSEEKWR
jgi:hypothetical protein